MVPVTVLATKGDKTVYNIVGNDEKECLTTLICGNAAGQMLPPMVLFPYKRIPRNIVTSMPKGWGIGCSDSGWMTAETFYGYISNVFYPWLLKNEITFPIILYLDGHASHLSYPLTKFCREMKIELVALYPNATHILQPMDVAMFRPLKAAWSHEVREWRMEHNGESLKRENFAPILEKSLKTLNISEILKNGFNSTGLHPFCPDAINYKKYFASSEIDNTAETESTSNSSQVNDHLRFIENNIEDTLLEEFRSQQQFAHWNGAQDHASLFLFWQKKSHHLIFLRLAGFNLIVMKYMRILLNEDVTLVLKTCTIWHRIKYIVNTVAAKARSLVHNSDSNQVESFNNIIAKFIGGKRINFSLRQGYEARYNAAVVSFNTKRPLSTLHRTILGKSPRSQIKKIEGIRIKRQGKRSKCLRKGRRLFPKTKECDKDYGENCQKPDMTTLEYIRCKEDFLKILPRSEEDRRQIEKSTILQRDSTPTIFQNGFRKCGLIRWNPDKVCCIQEPSNYESTELTQIKKMTKIKELEFFLNRKLQIMIKLLNLKIVRYRFHPKKTKLFKYYKNVEKCINNLTSPNLQPEPKNASETVPITDDSNLHKELPHNNNLPSDQNESYYVRQSG
ncbi:unnamed protein product [Euphydryas editha]|uniref:DDE-1 domain-containing protein n=1 Tax=Euphydryas editha TaxID=104508 RepID=A0AAU9TTY8_EUPED|nr:unnamed protein product [Euphydryas editha]